MSNEAGLNEEIAILEWKQLQRTKIQRQKAQFDSLPDLIHVTYVGDKNQFMHTGRSRAARANPFHFQRGIAIAISQKEDIKYFTNHAAAYFKVEEMTEAKLAQVHAKNLENEAIVEKAKADALAKIAEEDAKAEKAQAEADAKQAKADAKAAKGDK